jgi:hypothetical protein
MNGVTEGSVSDFNHPEDYYSLDRRWREAREVIDLIAKLERENAVLRSLIRTG